jgi:predicted Na+-dependent transporter
MYSQEANGGAEFTVMIVACGPVRTGGLCTCLFRNQYSRGPFFVVTMIFSLLRRLISAINGSTTMPIFGKIRRYGSSSCSQGEE